MATNWLDKSLKDTTIQKCMHYGQLMCDGHVGLGNVKHRDIDNVENYTDGKMSEYLFAHWLKINGIVSRHRPFREDYSVLDHKDDFIIEIGGTCVQVEVRHKTRNFPPRPHYEHCSDTIKMDRIYVFTDRTRADGAKETPVDALDHYRGTVYLLGWIDPVTYRQKARFEPAGTVKTNDQGGRNFTLQRDEWNIEIADLFEMEELIDGSKKSLIPTVPCP